MKITEFTSRLPQFLLRSAPGSLSHPGDLAVLCRPLPNDTAPSGLTWALSSSPYTVKMLVSGRTMTAWGGICARLQAANWDTSARAPFGHSSSKSSDRSSAAQGSELWPEGRDEERQVALLWSPDPTSLTGERRSIWPPSLFSSCSALLPG